MHCHLWPNTIGMVSQSLSPPYTDRFPNKQVNLGESALVPPFVRKSLITLEMLIRLSILNGIKKIGEGSPSSVGSVSTVPYYISDFYGILQVEMFY